KGAPGLRAGGRLTFVSVRHGWSRGREAGILAAIGGVHSGDMTEPEKTESLKALVVGRDAEKKQAVGVRDLTVAVLVPGEVTIRVTYCTVNYKDGLAITGKLPGVRRWPMVPGVDFCGEVVASDHAEFKPGN